MIVNNFCICGHLEFRHTDVFGCAECWEGKEKFSIRYHRTYHEYKLDNLRYLEEIAYQKGFE